MVVFAPTSTSSSKMTRPSWGTVRKPVLVDARMLGTMCNHRLRSHYRSGILDTCRIVPLTSSEILHVRLLSHLLRHFIRRGTLRVRDTNGDVHVFGGRLPGPDVAIHLHDRKLYIKLFINPELHAAEAYMDGRLTLEDGAAIHDFLLLFSVNRAGLYAYGSQKLMRRAWRGPDPRRSGPP